MVALFEQPVSFDANALVRKEISLIGSYAYAESDCQEAFDLLASRRVDMRPLISATMPLAQADEAFSSQLEVGAVKIQLSP
jgi:threonine dehydrogenase-like Zn-dependent dehydrogenase